MSVPAAAARRYSKYFLILGHVWTGRIDDANGAEAGPAPQAQKFGPVCRIDTGASGGGPLMMMWLNVAREFSAANSYQQVAGAQGSVAAYSWSATGRTGGGTGSSATYEFSSTGLKTITCEVTDDNGYSVTGKRWVRVVDVPGGAAPPILAFDWEGMAEDVPESGFGGCRVRVECWDSAQLGNFTPGRSVAIFEEFYEDGVKTADGEVFSGFVLSAERSIDPRRPVVVAQCGTIEALLAKRGMDGDYHIFVDNGLAQAAVPTPVTPGMGVVLPDTGHSLNQPWHAMDYLSIGKIVYHLFRYHVEMTIDGDTYSLLEVIDFNRDWWNDGTQTALRLYAFGVQRGPLLSQVASLLPNGLWAAYSSRLSQLSITRHHVGKTVADDITAVIDPDACYEVVPLPGEATPVRQAIVVQADHAKRNLQTAALFRKYPAGAAPAGAGGLEQPTLPFWFNHADEADTVAKALYDYRNSTDHVEVHLAGRPLGAFNVFTITVSGFWTAQDFWAVRVVHERTRGSLGGHRTRVLGRIITID